MIQITIYFCGMWTSLDDAACKPNHTASNNWITGHNYFQRTQKWSWP